MKNKNFPQNSNKVSTYGINKVMSAPEQSPMVIPLNIETPMILRGEIDVISGPKLFEYTDIEAGEFTLDEYTVLFMSIDYILTPDSAEGNLLVTVYKNGEVYLSLNQEIVHNADTQDIGMINFDISDRKPTDIWKITGYTTTENIVFEDVINNSNGEVERSALTMFIQEAGV